MPIKKEPVRAIPIESPPVPALPKRPEIPLKVPAQIPKKAQVTMSVKYDQEVETENTVPKPANPMLSNLAANMAANNGQIPNRFVENNIGSLSDNPIREFLDECENEPDVYVQIVRLPDNPLTNENFNTPCSHTMNFAPFPLNAKSFINDIQKINGNSGGKFKAIALDENMREIGVEMRTTSIANPYTEKNHNNNNQTDSIQMIVNEMREQQKVLLESLKNPPQTSNDLDVLARDLLLKRLANLDNPQNADTNAAESNPLVALMKNPDVTRTAMQTFANGLTGMFTANNTKNGEQNKSIMDRVMEVWANDAELRKDAMKIVDKGISLIGFGIASIKKNQPPKERAKNSQPSAQPPTETVISENDYVDAEDLEYEKQQEELKNAPLTQAILTYVDSNDELSPDNEFMKQAQKDNPLQYKITIATLKAVTFEEAYEMILNDFGFVEELVLEQPRRLERLKEFHALLVNG